MRQTFDAINKRLNWTVDRLCLREHYDKVEELVGRLLNNPYTDIWKEEDIQRGKSTLTETEQARTLLYEFLTSTQDLIKKPDLEKPYIFDLLLKKTEIGQYFLQVGILSTSKISRAEFEIKRVLSKEENEANPMVKTANIPKKSGLHLIPLPPLEKGRRYQIHCEITNKVEITYGNTHFYSE